MNKARRLLNNQDTVKAAMALSVREEAFEMTPAYNTKLAIQKFIEDKLSLDDNGHPITSQDRPPRSKIIHAIVQEFNISISQAYKLFLDSQALFDPAKLFTKEFLNTYIINEAMHAIEAAKAKEDVDIKGIALNLGIIEKIKSTLGEKLDRPDLPTPIYLNDPNLLPGYTRISDAEKKKIIAELRAKRVPKIAGGQFVDFKEVTK